MEHNSEFEYQLFDGGRGNGLLNPKIDPIFKSMFTQNTKESKKALSSFLGAIFNQPIEDLEVGKNEIPIESERDKQSIFDITCTLKNQQQVINIEMQAMSNSGAFDNRSEYHVGHLLNHYVHRGTPWIKVPQAYMISVLNFVYDKNSQDYFSWYTMRKDNGDELKSKRMNIIYLELPKLFEKNDEDPKFLTSIERWGKFLLYANQPEKVDYVRTLIKSEEGIMNAQSVLNEISQSDEEWRRERDYIDAVNTELSVRLYAEQQGHADGLAQGIAEGLEEGLAKGRAEGLEKGLAEGLAQGRAEGDKSAKLEIARNLLARGFSKDETAELTRLSLQELASL